MSSSATASPRVLEDLDPEDKALVERILTSVMRYRMGVPAIFMLEAFSPMAVVGSQAMHFLSPVVGTFGMTGDYDRLAKLLEKRDLLEAVIREIEGRVEAADGPSDGGVDGGVDGPAEGERP